MIHVARSRIILPERVTRQLDSENEQKLFKRRMALFSAVIGIPSGVMPATLLWACAGHPLLFAFFGALMAGIIVMGIHAWLPLIFGGTRIPNWAERTTNA